MKVEIYSDVVCPWCYIGERRFERALAAYPEEVEVVYRPFQLDADAPEAAVPIPEYLRRRFGRPVEGMMQQVGEAARGEGIAIDWDRALAVNTREAHRLLELALREHGVETQRALVEKLFEAHFTGGGDVADHELLTELAASVGMDRERVRTYLGAGEGASELEAEFATARRLGVRAVPTFVFEGEFVVEGAQSASTFLQVLEEVERRTAPVGSGDGAACDDGSCTITPGE